MLITRHYSLLMREDIYLIERRGGRRNNSKDDEYSLNILLCRGTQTTWMLQNCPAQAFTKTQTEQNYS